MILAAPLSCPGTAAAQRRLSLSIVQSVFLMSHIKKFIHSYFSLPINKGRFLIQFRVYLSTHVLMCQTYAHSGHCQCIKSVAKMLLMALDVFANGIPQFSAFLVDVLIDAKDKKKVKKSFGRQATINMTLVSHVLYERL